jgi:hypothetical protein
MAGWIRDRFGSLLDNALYEGVRLLIVVILLPILYAAWRFVIDQPLQWTVLIVFIALGLLAFALLGFGALNQKKHTLVHSAPIQAPALPTAPSPDLSYLADPAYDHFWRTPESKIRRADRLAKTINHRLSVIEKTVIADSANVALLESLEIESRLGMQLQNAPTPVECVEPQLVEEAFSIDREFGWSIFYEIAVAAKRLNERIADYNLHFRLAMNRGLIEQIPKIRHLITRYEEDKQSLGSSS